MSRRFHFVQINTICAVSFLAAILTRNLYFWDALAWCLLALCVGIFRGTVAGFALDEYRPPKPGFWRVGWRR